jgi:homoserine kinase
MTLSMRAFAPGSIGNLGPGLDILGCAVCGPGDTVEATPIEEVGRVYVDNPGHRDLPRDPTRHASAIAAAEVLKRANADFGVAIRVRKGLPLAGGQGGSAASAIAGAVAVNALLSSPLEQMDVLRAALVAEERVAGRHLDNLAPAFLGGIVLVRGVDPPDIVQLPVPNDLRVVIVHPAMQLRTADARAVLPTMIDRATGMAQAAAVASLVMALCMRDLRRMRGTMDDRIAEPVRAPLLPGFAAAKVAAMKAGALGCSIAGGGPSSFAFTQGEESAEVVRAAMLDAYRAEGMEATARVTEIDDRGARIEIGGPPIE